MPIRIAVDARLLDYQPAGIATYTRRLLDVMPSLAPEWRFLALRSRKRQGTLWSGPNLRERVLYTPPHHRWEQLLLPLETGLARPHLVHSPDFVPCFRRRWRSVITVHDLSFVRFPRVMTSESHRYYGQVARACRSADRVIAVSESTRRDLVELLGVSPDSITVIYEAAAPAYRPSDDPARLAESLGRLGLAPGYLLFVGTIEPRKNLDTLLRALARLRATAGGDRRIGGLRLVVVGRPGWLYQGTMHLVAELGLWEFVRFFGAASEAELVMLYNGAVALAYPSLYEGFGLPPLEAMACGTPVVVANTSALPEVVGDAGMLVEPGDEEAWAGAIHEVVTNDALRLELGRRGLERARLFSWERAAAATLAVYAEALGARI